MNVVACRRLPLNRAIARLGSMLCIGADSRKRKSFAQTPRLRFAALQHRDGCAPNCALSGRRARSSAVRRAGATRRLRKLRVAFSIFGRERQADKGRQVRPCRPYPSAGNLHPQECAPAGRTKTEPAVTRSERPAISWRATQKRRQTSRTLAERRRPVCCVIGLRPPAGVLHSAFDRPPWPTRRCVV